MRHGERMILAKLREQGVPLDSPDADLQRACAEVVGPSICLRTAKRMRDRMGARQ